jgi:hypothetical protein
VLELDPGRLDGVRAKGPERLPVVLSHMVHPGLLWVEAETTAVEKDRRFKFSRFMKPPTRRLIGMILLFIPSATALVIL